MTAPRFPNKGAERAKAETRATAPAAAYSKKRQRLICTKSYPSCRNQITLEPPQPGQRIMKKRPASEGRRWMSQPRYRVERSSSRPGGSCPPPKSSAFYGALFHQQSLSPPEMLPSARLEGISPAAPATPPFACTMPSTECSLYPRTFPKSLNVSYSTVTICPFFPDK